jgi:hypothetical protein
MKRLNCVLIGTLFAFSTLSALACSGDQLGDGNQVNAPSTPKT